MLNIIWIEYIWKEKMLYTDVYRCGFKYQLDLVVKSPAAKLETDKLSLIYYFNLTGYISCTFVTMQEIIYGSC